MLTHCPTRQFQPMMQELIHECDLMIAPRRIVDRLMQAPSSTMTSGPIVTFGPILQPEPIWADGSYIRSTQIRKVLDELKGI